MKNTDRTAMSLSAIWLSAITLVIVFGVESAIMFVLSYFPPSLNKMQIVFLDSFMLVLTTFPFLHYFLYKPLILNHSRRAEAEGKLRRQNDFLSQILESLPFPFYVIDAQDYRILTSNSAATDANWAAGAVFCYKVTHGLGAACSGGDHVCPLDEVKRTGKPVYVEHIHRDKNGGEINVGLYGFPIFDHKGGVHKMIEYAVDITEQKRAEKELRKSNAELQNALEQLRKAHDVLARSEKLTLIGTLASGVAHETLNPLNIISTIVQMMQMEETSKETRENLDEIMVQVRRAVKIMNDIRMFAHQKVEERVPLDMHTLFDKTAALMERDLSLDNISIKREYATDLPLIYGDEDKLAQVFLNLLKNARDAMKWGKNNRITVQTGTVEGGVEIRFSDTGTGIPPKILSHIFDPFFTTKDPKQGTGLGLSLVQSIIENHGGAIRAESEEGKGAAFIIALPVRREE